MRAGVVQCGEIGVGQPRGGAVIAHDAGQRLLSGVMAAQQCGQAGDGLRVVLVADARAQPLVFGPAGDDVVGEVLDEPHRPDQ